VRLARVAADAAPADAEALGLLALLLLIHARRDARTTATGAFVPLPDQDPERWDRNAVAVADDVLRRAHALGDPGRYQIEAAIQTAHRDRVLGLPVPDAAVLALYDALIIRHPALGAHLGRCAALAAVAGPAAALADLDRLPRDRLADHAPAWALRADLLARLGRPAAAAYRKAAGLTPHAGRRAWLLARAAGAG
jgi:RNA polymerase sigma-70 factor (ECF subfamily)